MNHEPVIDAHTHFIPPRFADEVGHHPEWGTGIEERDGQRWIVHDQGFAYPLFETFLGGPAKLEDMDRRGVDVSVMSLAPTLFYYWIDPAEGRAFARMTNEALAEIVRVSDGRLVGMASLPMQDPKAAAAEFKYAVEELGMCGAQVGTSVEGRNLDDPAFLPFWEAANDLRVPVMLHPYYVGAKEGLEDYYLTNIFGNPLDTASAAARIVFSGLLERFSDLSVILVHGGGFLPYQIGRLDHGWRVRPEPKTNLDRPPSEYVTRFWFDTITHNDHALAWLCDFMGPDRVLLGTDLPFDMADPDPVARLERAITSDEAKARVRGANAIALFGLEGVRGAARATSQHTRAADVG